MFSENHVLPHVKLQVAIAHPSIEDCWMEGYEAALNNEEETVNPFQTNTKNHQAWEDGWWAGFYKDEPLFTAEAEMEPIATNMSVTSGVKKSPTKLLNYQSWLNRLFQIASSILFIFICYELADLVT